MLSTYKTQLKRHRNNGLVTKDQKHLFDLDEDRNNKKPVTRIRATEESLTIAQSVADDLNIQMDEEKTRSLAMNLLGIYFSDITRVIKIQDPSMIFDHFVSDDISAYSGFTIDRQAIIFFDQNLDNWLFSIFQIFSIRAFFVVTDDVRKDTNEILSLILSCLKQPSLHLNIRDRLRPYMSEYYNALPVINCLTMTSNAFIICHEIAHFQLKHNGKANNYDQEYQADQVAYKHLLTLCNTPNETNYLKITPNFLCTPCLLMRCFDLVERFYAKEAGACKLRESHSHPPSEKRGIALERANSKTWNSEAWHLYDGFNATIDELASDLELP